MKVPGNRKKCEGTEESREYREGLVIEEMGRGWRRGEQKGTARKMGREKANQRGRGSKLTGTKHINKNVNNEREHNKQLDLQL